jgi:Coiled-coil domain-containing protein 90-like
MGAVPFDTLKLARRLETAGFPPKQAGDIAEALSEAMSGAELATSADITSVRMEVTTLGAELRAEIAALGAEVRAEIAAVRAEIELLRRDLTIRLGSMLIVAVGILLAAIRYLPPPHP